MPSTVFIYGPIEVIASVYMAICHVLIFRFLCASALIGSGFLVLDSGSCFWIGSCFWLVALDSIGEKEGRKQR